MYTIKEDVSTTLEIKDSKFITLLKRFDKDDDLKEIMKDIKWRLPKADHYCYYYIIEDKEYGSDDGEPSGTAKAPIMNCLKKNNMSNILCVVVRYFGGTKLGAGPLTRAYSTACSNTLKHCSKIKVINGYKVKINLTYTNQKKVDKLLKDVIILEKNYAMDIVYIALIEEKLLKQLKKLNINITVLEEETF